MQIVLTNLVEIRIVGMSRSGNHFITEWILQQISGRYCFLNCAEGKSNPFHTARPLEDGASFRTNIPDFDLEREGAGALARKDYLIHSYEDSFLAHACSRSFDERHDAFVGASGRRIDLLVLRDPFNLFASRAHWGSPLCPRTAARMWKQHAKAFVGRSPHLRQEKLLVSYNAFVRSSDYRRDVARALGLDFSDRGLGRVARCGGGSSFDGTAFDGHAWRMPVFERWRRMAGDPGYRSLFDPEILALSRKIFADRSLPHDQLRLTEAARSAAEPRREQALSA